MPLLACVMFLRLFEVFPADVMSEIEQNPDG